MNAAPASRTAAVAHGVSALGAAGLIIFAVPTALWRFTGWPLPRAVPLPTEVVRALQDGYVADDAILKALAIVCWLAWAQLVAALVVEAAAVLRARPSPRIPLGRPAQQLAAHLIAGIGLLGTLTQPSAIARSLTLPAIELAADIGPPTWSPAAPRSETPPDETQQEHRPSQPSHEVQPRDDLWSIADARLGDPYRWRDIWALNAERHMPDGRVFTDPDLIHPGWILDLPADAAGLPATAPDPASPDTNDVRDDPAAIADPATAVAAPDAIDLPRHSVTPGPAESATSKIRPDSPAVERATPAEGLSIFPSGAVVGAAFASGVAAALAMARLHRRRRYQPRDPLPGIRHREPLAGELIRALRRHGSPSPDVLEEPSADAPTQPDTTRDTSPTGTIQLGERDHHSIDWDLLDSGGLALDGEGATDVARAIATGLLASAAGPTEVLVVGEQLAETLFGDTSACPPLQCEAKEHALTRLEIELVQRTRLLDTAGVGDYRTLVHARPEEPTPLLAVIADLPPGDGRFDTIMRLGPRLGIVPISFDGFNVPSTISVDQDGQVTAAATKPVAALLGASLAQMTQQAAVEVLAVLAAAHDSALQDAAPTVADAADEPTSWPAASDATPVEVSVFGHIRISVHGVELAGGLRGKAKELAVFLIVHPNGATAEAAAAALWPDADLTRSTQGFSTALGNLRSTLRATSGLDHAAFVDRIGERYQIDPSLVDSDLWRFQHALTAAAHADSDDHAIRRALREAIDAYSGDLAEASWYEWAEAAREDLRRRALDAATRLAEITERDGDIDDALAVLDRAITIDPYAEELYRRTMRLQCRCVRPDAVQRTYHYLETRLTELDAEPDDTTVALRAELLAPGSRPQPDRDTATHARRD